MKSESPAFATPDCRIASAEPSVPVPFKICVPQETLGAIRAKVRDYPWGYMPDDGGWGYGTNLGYMKEICRYWVDEYDWRLHEARLNEFSQAKVAVGGVDLHFVHERGSGPSPMPLLITHGWPGSIVEYQSIIEPLAHPERFGGSVDDAFDVIAPSLPGFGFSGRPPRPMGPRAMARVLDELMTSVLGYGRYMAQGGDWGSAISSWLGYDHAQACSAIHINFPTMRHAGGPQTDEERAWAEAEVHEQAMEDGYRTLQATRPQTLSYAMADSPVGVAAWIIEKFHAWSDIEHDDIESVYSKDTLLTNIMIYLVTGSFNSASWIYYGRREEGGRQLGTEGRRVEVPTAAALFPAEMLTWPPRSYVERLYNLQRWTEMPRGGHFASLEQPQLLVDDIRSFARSLRQQG
jgi:microsomal epoxide hydrolase